MVLLGHKSLRYVLLYAQLSEVYNIDKGYVCKEAYNLQEASSSLKLVSNTSWTKMASVSLENLNTQLYIELVNTESDDYHLATAKNIEEESKLVEAGFEYVCDFDGNKLFRKRK